MTRQYLHLAGIVFQDEAAALEQRLFGGTPKTGRKFYPTERTSADLTSPDPSESGVPAPADTDA